MNYLVFHDVWKQVQIKFMFFGDLHNRTTTTHTHLKRFPKFLSLIKILVLLSQSHFQLGLMCAFLQELNARKGNHATSAGFTTHSSNDRAKVASMRMSRGHTGNAAADNPASDTTWDALEYYYMTANDQQIGPATLKELRTKWKAKEVNGECVS